jgi:DNA-binding YbaB/EbfC family protein
MSSIGKLMKQAARMQQQMEQVQAQLAARTVEATSGGGAVKVTAKCDGTIASIKIDPQALNPSDAQLLEDMIVTAANQALGQAKEISNAEMGKVTAGSTCRDLADVEQMVIKLNEQRLNEVNEQRVFR